MNDYISKPIQVENLVTALHKCSQHLNAVQTQVTGTETENVTTSKEVDNQPETPAVLNESAWDDLRDIAGDEDEVIVDVVNSYLQDTPNLLDALFKAIATEDEPLLTRSAHTLKSSSATFGAQELAQMCKQLELLDKDKQLDQAAVLVKQIQTEYPRVKMALELKLKKYK